MSALLTVAAFLIGCVMGLVGVCISERRNRVESGLAAVVALGLVTWAALADLPSSLWVAWPLGFVVGIGGATLWFEVAKRRSAGNAAGRNDE